MILLPFLAGAVAVAQAALATAIEWAVTSAIIGGLVGGAIGVGSEVAPAVTSGEEIQFEQVIDSGVQGAATGVITGAASGALLGGVVGGVGAGVNLARGAILARNTHLAANACGAGCVYGIKHATKPNVVKIGYTTNPAQRLPDLVKNYKTSSQFTFIRPVSGGKLAEKALHNSLGGSQVTRGVVGKEFFALDDFALARSFSF